jgi:hypothetical protein
VKFLSDANTARVEQETTPESPTERRQEGRAAGVGSDLLSLWWEKQRATNLVRHDPRLLVLHGVEEACGAYGWGTVFYSKAREDYKTRVGSLPEKRAATFDLELMSRLLFARAGGLNIAANPNSIVPGHLVVWPEEKRAELTRADLSDVSRLARAEGGWTFIHNMERAAASIVDWAHFQAYPWEFPLARAEACETIHETAGFRVSRVAETYPAYALAVEAESTEILSAWLHGMLRAFKVGAAGTNGAEDAESAAGAEDAKRAGSAESGTGAACASSEVGAASEVGMESGVQRGVPCNIVWRGARAWLIPRSPGQTTLAATYVGALEMGGLFCLPNADSLRRYLPDALRAEVRGASIADDAGMRAWCERAASETAVKLCGAGGEST